MTMQYGWRLLTAGALACVFTGLTDHPASAQVLSDQHQLPVTAVGCLQREKDYRQQQGKHDGGFLGTGKGESNEYILVDAIIGGPALAIDPVTENESSCLNTSGTGQAFELTGHGEPALDQMVGRRVAINGMLKHAKHDTEPVGTSGTFTPIPKDGDSHRELELREINVDSFSLVPIMQRAAAPEAAPSVAAAPAPEPAAAPTPEAPAPTAPAELPKTASPFPFVGLIGLLSLAGGLALHAFNRGRATS